MIYIYIGIYTSAIIAHIWCCHNCVNAIITHSNIYSIKQSNKKNALTSTTTISRSYILQIGACFCVSYVLHSYSYKMYMLT